MLHIFPPSSVKGSYVKPDWSYADYAVDHDDLDYYTDYYDYDLW